MKALFEPQVGCNAVIALSCYSSLKSLREFWKLFCSVSLKSQTTFKIYLDFNAMNPATDPELSSGLMRLSNTISKRCSPDSGIFLVNCGKLFHPKLYCFRWKCGAATVYVGSPNLSLRAFNENEEMLYKLSSSEGKRASVWLDRYTHHLEEKCGANRVGKILPASWKKRRTIREMLLSGRMFFERDEHDRFRVCLHLPKEFRRLPSSNVFVTGRLGNSVSIRDILTRAGPDGLGITDPFTSGNRVKPKQPKWKQYAVQTCYGYWVPFEYLKHLNDGLDKWMAEREQLYRNLIRSIISNRRALTSKFQSVVVGYYEEEIHSKGLTWRGRKAAEQAWERKLNWLDKNQKNVGFIRRIAADIENVKVPDVWNDPDSALMAENSFLLQLLYDYEKADLRRTNKVARAFHVILCDLTSGEIDPDDDQNVQVFCRRFEKEIRKEDVSALLRRELREPKRARGP